MNNFFQDDTSVSFVIYGEPASKANSRRMVLIKGAPRLIKSKKALDYCKTFAEQCPTLDDLIEGDVSVEIKIYYASRRPDLDESVILDEMQGKIYTNDRQVKQKHIHWGLDRDNPRSHICVKIMEGSDSTGDP
jgi:Holliday junction resolvase RusA-like endonuclease